MARMLSWASGLLRGYEIEMARLKKRREGLLKQVRRLKVKHSEKGKLSPAQIAALLTAWDRDKSYIGARNTVLIHLLLYTGLRRSELAALRWDNVFRINEECVIRVAKGKGGKEREVLVFDPSPRTLELMASLAADAMVGRAPIHVHRRRQGQAYTRKPGGEHISARRWSGRARGESRCRT